MRRYCLPLLILACFCGLLWAQPPRAAPGTSQPPLVRPRPKPEVPDARPIAPGTTLDATGRSAATDTVVAPRLREPTEQEIAAAALGRIGRAAVPSLIQALGHRDPEVREQAALVLARIGPDAHNAVPELTAALDDDNTAVRKAAARALGQIGPAAEAAVPALMRALVQPRPVPPDRR